jgi:hypothetical protein
MGDTPGDESNSGNFSKGRRVPHFWGPRFFSSRSCPNSLTIWRKTFTNS